MSIQKTLFAALTSSLLFGTSVRAQEADEVSTTNNDPFEVSDVACKENQSLGCMKVTKGTSATLGDIIKIFNDKGFSITIEQVRFLNGWSDVVTEETRILHGKEFAISGIN